MELTQKLLKEEVTYDKETGIFTRNKNNSKSKKGDVINRVMNRGYIQFSVLGKIYLGYRLAWLYEYGYMPKNQIDHINRIRTDNRICNLREVTNQENHRNRTVQSNSKTKITGVNWRSDRNRWVSYICINRKVKTLGYFKNKNDAIKARKDAEIKYNFKNSL